MSDWWDEQRKKRSLLYRLGDGVIGFDDGVETAGEALGKGINQTAKRIGSDPVGLLGELAGDTKRDLDNLMFEGGAMERPEAVLGYAAAPMAPGIAKMGRYDPNTMNAIKAYHGSPHDFDKFSMDKIGTGEGAQAYGHGLYFAENEGVARSYRDALSLDAGFSYKGKSGLTRDQLAEAIEADYGRGYLDNVATPRSVADSVADELIYGPSNRKLGPERAALRDSLRQSIGRTDPGSMYEVNINADPDDFLDWDAPLSAQPPALQDLAKDADLSGVSSRMRNKFAHWRGEYDPPEGLVVPEPTGNDLHSLLTDFGNDAAGNASLTRNLAEQGIPGIKYRDAGSRGADSDGTRNFVVFDENLIEIVRKYGIAGAAAMLGLSAAEVEAAVQ